VFKKKGQMAASQTLVLYVPVIHSRYLDVFRSARDRDIDRLVLIGDDLMAELSQLPREIRAVPALAMAQVIAGLDFFHHIEVLPNDQAAAKQLLAGSQLLLAREPISKQLLDWLGNPPEISLIETFLRWNEANVYSQTDITPDRVSTEAFDRQMLALAKAQASSSTDWWRQVGAVAVRNRRVILKSFNQHLPTGYTPYIDGDPRDVVRAGTDSQIATAIHAEQVITVLAASQGIALAGCDLYVTIFSCPMCAKEVALCGYRRLFFEGGHASLNGLEVLRHRGIEIIQVQ
jgi:dCMP deaminase